jgi:cytochrome c-type biogenesis protein CcmH/NrfG
MEDIDSGRTRRPLTLEGEILQTMEFPQQATYRFREALEIDSDNLACKLGLATATAESGNYKGEAHALTEMLSTIEIPNDVRVQVEHYLTELSKLTRTIPVVPAT